MNSIRTIFSRNARMRAMRTLTLLSGLILLTGVAIRSLLRKTNRQDLAQGIEERVRQH